MVKKAQPQEVASAPGAMPVIPWKSAGAGNVLIPSFLNCLWWIRQAWAPEGGFLFCFILTSWFQVIPFCLQFLNRIPFLVWTSFCVEWNLVQICLWWFESQIPLSAEGCLSVTVTSFHGSLLLFVCSQFVQSTIIALIASPAWKALLQHFEKSVRILINFQILPWFENWAKSPRILVKFRWRVEWHNVFKKKESESQTKK